MRNRFLFSIAISLALMASLAGADTPVPSRGLFGGQSLSADTDRLLASALGLAQTSVDPTQAVAASRTRLLTSIQQLERFLARGESDLAASWSEFLQLGALRRELNRADADLSALRSIEEDFYQNQIGLELPAFVAVRRQLRAFLTATEYAAAPSPHELYRERMRELTECLARIAAQPVESDAHRAGANLAWIESLHEDGAALAREARGRFCQTNGVAQGSGRLANYLMRRDVHERNYISEVVLGSLTRGMAITQGQVLFGTVPNLQQGTLEIRLQGRVLCPANVADRGRISVYTSAQTTLDARKRVFLDDRGLHLAPAVAYCSTSVNIRDIDAPRLIERVAWRRASKMMPEAEQLTSRRAESEAASKLDQQAGASLGNVNNIFCQQILAPLIRLDALPALLKFWSDESHLRLGFSQHNELQLAAAGPPPSLPASYDLAGCVHESMLNNLCESLLGGRPIHDKGWLEMMHLIVGTPPRPLWVHDRAERWSVVLEKQRPVIAEFESNRIGATLRVSEVRLGEQVFKEPVEISARFTPQITRDGPALIRDGDLTIQFADSTPSEDQASLHAFLSRKFGAVFPSELHFYGLMPPTGGSIGKLRSLHPVEFQTARGWLSVGYELADE